MWSCCAKTWPAQAATHGPWHALAKATHVAWSNTYKKQSMLGGPGRACAEVAHAHYTIRPTSSALEFSLSICFIFQFHLMKSHPQRGNDFLGKMKILAQFRIFFLEFQGHCPGPFSITGLSWAFSFFTQGFDYLWAFSNLICSYS